MSKRLQVLFDELELAEIRQAAERERMTVAEWVRQTLRRARRMSHRNQASKLAAIEQAMGHQFPTGGIEQVLGEIEAGYTDGAI